jgi:hypothetical protein
MRWSILCPVPMVYAWYTDLLVHTMFACGYSEVCRAREIEREREREREREV